MILHKKTADRVRAGEVIATLLTDRAESIGAAEELVTDAIRYSDSPAERAPTVYKIIR